MLDQNRNRTSIPNLNTQCLSLTFYEFHVMLNEYQFDIITMSETWLKDNQKLLDYIDIPVYILEYAHRDNKRGGGVGVYIKETFTYTKREDMINLYKSIEHYWLEISGLKKNSSYLVGIFYQPSSIEHDKKEWLDHFEGIITHASLKWNGVTLVTGDFNIDLIDGDKITVNKYNDILDTYGLTQHISYPTRHRKSLIDHISTNIPKKVICENVIPCKAISDHDPPFVALKIKKQKFQPRYKFVRGEKSFNLENCINDFIQLPLSTVYSFDDPDDQFETVNKLITDWLSHHAPIKHTKFTRPQLPWMKTLDIINLQKKRNKLRTTVHRTQTESDWELIRNTRNELKYKIKSAKRTFYKKPLASKKSKTFWRTIYRTLKPNPERSTASPTS